MEDLDSEVEWLVPGGVIRTQIFRLQMRFFFTIILYYATSLIICFAKFQVCTVPGVHIENLHPEGSEAGA